MPNQERQLVRREQRDSIAASDSRILQPRGTASRLPIQLRIGPRPLAIDQRGPRGVLAKTLAQIVDEVPWHRRLCFSITHHEPRCANAQPTPELARQTAR